MQIIFLGLLFCDDSLKQAYQLCKSGVQMAPNLFEKRLIDGLSNCENVEVEVISIPPIGSFPINYKKIYSPEYRLEGYTQIGYLNLPFIKHLIQKKKVLKEIKMHLHKSEINYILVYSLFEPYLDILNKIKKSTDNLHITILQPDAIPGRNDMVKSPQMDRKGDRLVNKAKCADDFVFLSKYLCDVIDLGKRNYTVVDCMCDVQQQKNEIKAISGNIFLYTGTTAKVFGIYNMVDAFKELPEAKLWICGSGDSDDYIRETALTYKNIEHFGYLTQEGIAMLRNKCDFLINPRVPTGTYTKYSFPSKTAEYLMSGIPTIMYKLEGISNEYDAFLNYLYAEDTQGIKMELLEYINSDRTELLKKAQQARNYMIINKNPISQSKKIINLMTHVETV